MERNFEKVCDPDVEAAWSEEIRRRLAEIDAGTVELIPWEEVRDELFSWSVVLQKTFPNAASAD